MKIAAIDIGTNSVKLLIAGHRKGRLIPLDERVVITRLGEGLGVRGVISLRAARRTFHALSAFKQAIDSIPGVRMGVVGTRALRAAKNSRSFLKRCEEDLGLKIRIISGRREAELAFRAALMGARARRAVTLDIGGGSAQISLGDRNGIEWTCSLPLGAVAVTEKYVRHDPPHPNELNLLRRDLARILKRPAGALLKRVRSGSVDFIGIGGTISTLTGLFHKGRKARPSFRDFESLTQRLSGMTTRERTRVGVIQGRADIIVAGAHVLCEVMRALRFSDLQVCTRGLRHGLALELASGRWR